MTDVCLSKMCVQNFVTFSRPFPSVRVAFSFQLMASSLSYSFLCCLTKQFKAILLMLFTWKKLSCFRIFAKLYYGSYCCAASNADVDISTSGCRKTNYKIYKSSVIAKHFSVKIKIKQLTNLNTLQIIFVQSNYY